MAVWWDPLGEPGEEFRPRRAYLGSQLATRIGQGQEQHPTVVFGALALDPAATFQLADQATDRALLQPEAACQFGLG